MSNASPSEELVLITGASSGIGKSVIHLLNKKNVRTVGISRNKESLREVKILCPNPNLFSYEVMDLSQSMESIPSFITQISKKYGKFSGYVHSAGVLNPQPLRVIDYNDCILDFNTNLFSALMITRALSSKKNRQDKLNIVYVSSIAAKIGNSGSVSYAMSKASLNAMVTTLAREIGSQKININSVMPGGVDTKMSNHYDNFLSYDYLETVKSKTTFNEICKPQYISDVICFLLSKESYWVQGQNIVVDGGESL